MTADQTRRVYGESRNRDGQASIRDDLSRFQGFSATWFRVDLHKAPDGDDILNIGGFSDAVFSVVSSFLSGDAGRFVAEVEAVDL